MKIAPHILSMLCGLALAGHPARAEMIDFEDRPASDGAVALSDEYADRGVQFDTRDGMTWSGLTGGDPGGWQLEGTRGPAFMGVEGFSSTSALRFDAPVSGFKLDLARGAGTHANFYDFVMVSGLHAGRPVDSRTVFLGEVNDWKTIELAGEMDRVVVFSSAFYVNFRFGVDNLRWDGGPEPVAATVDIDIKPGNARNAINLGSRGVVPVALYGSADFDVQDVDPDQLQFGPAGAAEAAGAELAHLSGPHVDHRNDDGHLDLLLHFSVPDAGLAEDDELACVHGMTLQGTPFEGCDAVNPVRARK